MGRIIVVLLLVALVVSSVFLMTMKASQSPPSPCSIPPTAGTYRGEFGDLKSGNSSLVFENPKNDTLSFYNSECKLVKTVTRN